MEAETPRGREAFIGLALAALLALTAFLPWGLWLGSGTELESQAYWRTLRGWMTWLAVVLPVSLALTAVAGDRIDSLFERLAARLRRLSLALWATILAAVALLAGASLSKVLFHHNPHLVDSIAQLFQARIFAQGDLTAPAPAQIEFFAASHLVQHAGRWFSQYPPGQPALLAVGLLSGCPWLVNPIFAAGTVVLALAVGRRVLGDAAGKLTALLLLFSPFALFMSASYMNHVTTGFFLVLSLYAAVRAADGDAERRWAVLLGLALAGAALIRPLEGAAWAVVLGGWLWLRRGPLQASLAGLVCLVALVPLLAYNTWTTGRPLRFGYTLLWGPGHGLGFHTDPWGNPFTPLTSFANTALDFQRLNISLFEWPFPSLVFLIIGIVAVGYSPRQRRYGPLLIGTLLAVPIAYFFYWHRDNYLGPRFLYASLVPVILLSVAGLQALDRRLGRWRPALRLFVASAVLYGLAVNLPDRAGVIAGLEPEMKLNPEADLRAAGVREALVFVKTGWGSRLIGRLWGWQIPASEVERTYRSVDGCRIQLALDRADSLLATGRVDAQGVRSGLRAQLERWRNMHLPVEEGVLPDPSVRVDESRPLTSACRREVQDDRAGFTLYGTLVWRNDPWLEDGIIFARHFDTRRDRQLAAKYADRPHFLYAPASARRGAPHLLHPLELTARSSDLVRGPLEEVEE